MKHVQIFWKVLSVIAFVGFPLLSLALQQVPSVTNTISKASLDENKVLSISGTLSREQGYAGPLYAVVSINGADYRHIDHVVAPEALVLDQSKEALEYNLDFTLKVTPARDNQIVMTWRNQDALPLDIDPVTLSEDSVFATEAFSLDYYLTQCRHDSELDVLFCTYQGEVPSEFSLTWYTR